MLDRIKQLMEKKAFTASQFADGMDVPRAVLSHILSGRNKPSLDVVLKIADTYTDVSLEWLLLGKGEMLTNLAADPSTKHIRNDAPAIDEGKPVANVEIKDATHKVQSSLVAGQVASSQTSGTKVIKQVIFFYTDGTFEAFKQTD